MSPLFPIGANLARLERLLGADAGLFVVALHAFIEGYSETAADREELPYTSPTLAYHGMDPQGNRGQFKRFAFKIWRLGAGRSAKAKRQPPVDLLRRLERAHQVTNAVRHGFAPLDPAWVPDHMALFLQFCKWADIPLGKSEAIFREVVATWNRRESSHPQIAQLRATNPAAVTADPGAALASLARAQEELTASEDHCRDLEARLEKAKESGGPAADDLEREWQQALQDREGRRQTVKDLAHVQAYRDHLLQFTLHTRTRRRYEASLRSWTPDQETAWQQILAMKDKARLRVIGHGGTGKTATMVEAIRRRERPWALLTPGEAQAKSVRAMAASLGITEVDRIAPWGPFLEEWRTAGAGPLGIDLYVDEAQDFPGGPARLPAVTGITVLAVDPLGSAGWDGPPPAGGGRPPSMPEIILDTTLRQTRPLTDLTRIFCELSKLTSRIPTPRAYREGPLPEWANALPGAMGRLITDRAAFHQEWLGYDLANLAVLNLSGAPLPGLPKGMACPGFDEARGTDYPVVFLVLGESEPASAGAMYHALSRAMDHLVIVSPGDPKGFPRLLQEAWRKLSAADARGS